MKEKSRTLRRLGVAGVGAAIAIGTPAVGFTGIAAADNPASLQIVSQADNTASTLNDGTNSTVKISAVETAAPVGAGNPEITSVRFTYQKTSAPADANPTEIATDTTAPYSVNWTPPSAGTYTLEAEPLATGGGSAGTPDIETDVVVSATAASVHISSPADAATVPFFTSGSTNLIPVSGTRSNGAAGLPSVDVTTQLRRNDTDALVGSPVTTHIADSDAGAAADASQAWSGEATVGTCPVGATSCDVIIRADANEGASDEAVQARLAAASQAVDGFTVTPASTVNASTNSPVTYTVSATDGGVPVAGVTVTAATNHSGTTTITPSATAVTGVDGKATFTFKDSASETSTLTFQTEFNGTSYVNGTDFQVTRTLVTSVQAISSITLTKVPSQPVYATQSYGEDNPVITACLKDQNGNAYTGSTTSVLATVDRTITGGSNSSEDANVAESQSPANSGCYQITASDYPSGNQAGNDLYTVYVNNNGVPGFQSGSSDVGATTTVTFAPGKFGFNGYTDCTNGFCKSQAQVGTVDTVTLKETAGSSPIAGDTVSLTLNKSASFPASQPSGAVRIDNNDATCVTAADGTCQVNVTDAVTEPYVSLHAYDEADGFSGLLYITFRTDSVAFNQVERGDHYTLIPTGAGGTDFGDYGAPGTVMIDTYTVEDASGRQLSDIPVTLNVDHGFFTPVPGNTDDYNSATFDPAAANGAQAGSLKSLGQSLTTRTDAFGDVTFALSIGRDTGFDDNGEVLSDVSFTSGGNSADGGNPAGSSVGDEDYTWTTDTNDTIGDGCALMTAPTRNDVSPSECSGGDLGSFITGGALNGTSVTLTPSSTGNVSSGFGNDAHPATTFSVQLKDQFGNLVGSDTNVTESGPGNGSVDCDESTTLRSSYTDAVHTCRLDSTGGTPTVAANDTVTDTWTTQSTTFKPAVSPGVGDPAFVATVDNTDVTKSDSFTVQLYAVDVNGLQYAYDVLPAHIVKTGTTVHDEVTVTDQYDNAVQGLFVNFDQSGPGAVDSGDNEVPTNANGTASYNFSSAVQGDATVTVDVYDCDFLNDNSCSGVPLSENVNTVSFDGVPTITLTGPDSHGHLTISGLTRAGAAVTLHKQVGSTGPTTVGSAQTAGSDGSYVFSTTISKTTKFFVTVDDLQTSGVRTATFTAPKITEKPGLKLASKHKGELIAKATTHPSLDGVTVKFFTVSGSGNKSLLGKGTTNSSGKVKATFDLAKGKAYTVVARAVHLGKKYHSVYSNAHTKKVKG